ncbi:cell adhesion molecule CEACAM20-like [Xenentodon cancila]
MKTPPLVMMDQNQTYYTLYCWSCFGKGILPKGPVDVVLGQNLTLKILVEKPSNTIIIWNYSDGKDQNNIGTLHLTGVTIDEQYQGRAFINSSNGYLTLLSLKTEDSGDYSINMVTTTTKSAEVKVRVLEPVSDVVIKSDKSEAIEHETTVVLVCSAKGSFLKFTWTNGTKPIVADGDRLTQTDDGLSSTLTIRNVLRSDLVGPIYCTAENTLEKGTSAPFNLTVFYGPESVTISPANPPLYVPSNSNFSLTCSAISNPTPTFTWYHNKDLILNGGAVLHLAMIKEQNLGKTMADYTCKVLNAKTKRNSTSPAVKFSMMEPVEGPKISGPTATLIASNSTANLSCKAESGDVKEISWLKDGKVLSPSADIVFSTDKSSIKFNTLTKMDNGKYTCKLSNPINSKEVGYEMVVNYGPEDVVVNGNKEVKVDKMVQLICSASSNPSASFTWKLNNTVIPVKKSNLTIERALYTDTGTYTCEAYNSITGKITTSSHFLSVKEVIDDGLSDGAIAGIVIACLVAVGAAIALFFYCRQKVPTESPY